MTSRARCVRAHVCMPPCVCSRLLCRVQAWLAEWMWTALLVLVVLSTASGKREPNMYFGLSIGAIVLTGDAFFGQWSNGMFNPAVGLGTCAVDVFEGQNADGLWIYLVRARIAVCSVNRFGRPMCCTCVWLCRRLARLAACGAATWTAFCLMIVSRRCWPRSRQPPKWKTRPKKLHKFSSRGVLWVLRAWRFWRKCMSVAPILLCIV